MATAAKKTEKKMAGQPPLDRKFASVEEGAKAKADYVMNTVLKDFDWAKFDEMRKSQTARQ